MGNYRSINELFAQYEQLLNEKREMCDGTNNQILMEKYRSLQSEIMSFCNSEGFLSIMKVLCRLNEGKLRFAPSQGRIEYMGRTPSPKPFDYNNCFEVKEIAKRMMLEVRSGSPKDETAIKNLCVGYVTLVAMANSAKELYARDLRARNAEMQGRIDDLDEKIRECEISLQDKISALYSEDNNGIYIGSRKVNVSPDVLRRVGGKLGIQGDLPDEKIILSTGAGCSSVFVTVSEKDKSSPEFRDFVNGIFYKNFLKYNVGELSVAFIEDKTLPALPISYMNGNIRNHDKEKGEANLSAYSYGSVAQDKQFADKTLASIVSEINERKILLGSSDKCGTIEEYNKQNIYSKKPYILLILSGYHKMLTSWGNDFGDLTAILKDGGRYGVFTVMLEEDYEILDEDSGKNIAPNFAELGVRRVDFKDPTFKKITAKPTEVDNIRLRAKDELKMSEILYLDDILAKNAKVSHFSKEITIPVGLSDGKIYYFATSVDATKGEFNASPFTLIIGNTGMGKSAFLHTLILSGAYCYSPDELQFYIVDFKGEQASPEFACYQYREGEKNLYIPHVRYLSMKSTAENAYDVIDMINTLNDQRQKIFTEVGAKDFVAYNSEEKFQSRVRRGELPRMPQIYFLIDEYITMLGGGVGGDQEASSEIEPRFKDILQRIRTSGVGLIFSGQHSAFGKEALAKIGNRISFDPGDESLLTKIYDFEIGKEDSSDLYRRIGGKVGTAAFTRKAGATQKDIVRTAFAGKHMGERQLAIAKAIREKYSDPEYYGKQIIPGSDNMESGNSFLLEDCSKQVSVEERKRQAQNKELNIPVYLGVSAMTAKPTCIRYYLQNHKGALVLARPPKQEYIERNAAVSLLHYMAVHKNTPSKDTIILNDMKSSDVLTDVFGNVIEDSSANHALEVVLEEQGLSHLCRVNHSALEISRAIMDADSLWHDRLKGQSADKKPIMLIVHDGDSLMSLKDLLEVEVQKLKAEDADRTPEKKEDFHKEEADKNEDVADADIDTVAVDLDFDDLIAEFGDDFADALGDVFDESITLDDVPDEVADTYSKDTRIFTADEVKRALKHLMEKGNSQNIFVLASFGSTDAAKEILGVDMSRRDLCKEYSGVVYGSDGVRKTQNLEKDENEECCFVMPQEMKARIYDFSSNATDFWRNLKKYIK